MSERVLADKRTTCEPSAAQNVCGSLAPRGSARGYAPRYTTSTGMGLAGTRRPDLQNTSFVLSATT